MDVLLFDDFQMLEGKEATMEFFCNHFNKLHMDGKQIVIAMDRSISSFTEVPDRMISRLEWGKIVEIAQ